MNKKMKRYIKKITNTTNERAIEKVLQNVYEWGYDEGCDDNEPIFEPSGPIPWNDLD